MHSERIGVFDCLAQEERVSRDRICMVLDISSAAAVLLLDVRPKTDALYGSGSRSQNSNTRLIDRLSIYIVPYACVPKHWIGFSRFQKRQTEDDTPLPVCISVETESG